MGGDLCKNNRSDGLTAQNKNSKNVEGASCKKNQNDGLAAQNDKPILSSLACQNELKRLMPDPSCMKMMYEYMYI